MRNRVIGNFHSSIIQVDRNPGQDYYKYYFRVEINRIKKILEIYAKNKKKRGKS